MKISEVILKDWMIFGGNQHLSLAQGTSNVSLIFGENMHGKTSLLNAIRWCLYGSAINRQGKAIPARDLINILAVRNGVATTSVELIFEVDGSKYQLLRELDTTSGSPIDSTTLKIDGRLTDGGKIEAIIENLIPKQISQFMLFDGELLRNFENLVVAVGSQQANGIKNAIEETLGIPLLRRAFDNTEYVVSEFKKESKNELQRNANTRMISGKINELELKIETYKKEIYELETTLESYVSNLSELDEALHDTEEAIRLIERKKALQSELLSRKDEQIEIQNNLKQLSSNLWLVPLKKAVNAQIESYKEKLRSVNDMSSAQSSKTVEMLKLERSLEHSNCPTCGNILSPDKIEDIKAQLTLLKDEISNSGNLEELKFELMTNIKKLEFSSDTPDETEKYKVNYDRDIKLEHEILGIENRIYEIEQSLKGVDEQNSLSVRKEYDTLNREIGVIEKDIKDHAKLLEDCENEIRAIRKSKDFQEISENSDALLKTEISEQIRDVLKAAIALYRDEMRSNVERRATETFQNLTTEKTFDKLVINESYGLSLVVDGTTVNRSAGAEQIVAMSLIESLNYHGRRTGPMIMDTPVGRLDVKHRKNIMEYLPTVVTQLAIFAHSGELTEESDLIDPCLVGARYRIERVSTFQSNLVRI